MAYDTWTTDTIPITPTGLWIPSTMSAKQVYFIDRGTNFYLFDYSTQTWTVRANPTADANRLGGGIVRGGKVYYPGTTKIHIHDIAGNSWSESAAAPNAVSLRTLCFEDDDTIWCYGASAGVRDDVWRYVISTNSWTEYASDSAYNVAWCVLWKADVLYAGTNNGVRKFVIGTETYSLVDAAAGRDWTVGHDPDALGFSDGVDDYGYWKFSDLTLYDDVVSADSVTNGYQRYGAMSPDRLDVVAWKNGTEVVMWESTPPAPSSVGGFNPALLKLIL